MTQIVRAYYRHQDATVVSSSYFPPLKSGSAKMWLRSEYSCVRKYSRHPSSTADMWSYIYEDLLIIMSSRLSMVVDWRFTSMDWENVPPRIMFIFSMSMC
jgi:hypothetical protein